MHFGAKAKKQSQPSENLLHRAGQTHGDPNNAVQLWGQASLKHGRATGRIMEIFSLRDF